ncbi:dipeptidase [Enterococcus cecorum]|uniref:dipeptidase n=2 Tax=Enterococcus cecorum TaxID=44008 RepID=UPI000A62191E|nr:dipeptidase [Enterococcus cecorum]MCJ0543417.1 dipeptidase [Enterococcus cecorum]MCJ0548269.1 dipeptidase [Enterococcus cecorum]CAI3327550.1 membrane dipeptidase [Enterococcus cecorum]CAI3424498.1 membrane dipeptidase [Enterococcus cecorum]
MPIIDLHCDTIMKLYENPNSNLLENHFQIDLKRLQQKDFLLQTFAIFLDKQQYPQRKKTALHMYQRFIKELEKNAATIGLIKTQADYNENKANKQISALLTLEEGGILEGKIENLEEFYQLGVRLITLTWNYPNEIGTPNILYWDKEKHILAENQTGLTKFGFECIQRMSELHMIIDLSHASDQVAKDILDSSAQGIVASHSNSRKLTPHPRNLSDELIQKIADKNGLIGINFFDQFLKLKQPTNLPAAISEHLWYMYQLVGEDSLCFGSDFDGIPVHADLNDVNSFPKIIQALKQKGFTSRQIEKISYLNAENFLQHYLPKGEVK